tara:strand:- start:1945 stop:2262 length:318 start_codon:yes stop_codon:yes gene_type:complete
MKTTVHTSTPSACQPGAIVRHTGDFCRMIGWNTPPINGIVVSVRDGYQDTICTVWWCDREAGDGIEILARHLELHPGGWFDNEQTSDSMRDCLLAEFHAAQEVTK